jgi:starvation-inducible DNA-binding protein
MSKNYIGLDKEQTKELSVKLNDLLANYQIFYMNVRGFHWNIKGGNFFELHQKFEEMYDDLLLKIDEVAERILTLEHDPLHSYSVYIKQSEIKEVQDLSDGKEAVKHILDSFAIILEKQRDILKLAGESNDEGTVALMSEYISEQEKTTWMYRSYLGK